MGFDPLYVPLGIDTKVFRPKPEGRKDLRDSFGWTDENFVIGSVGLNYHDDRKGFIPLMMAFREFHALHPEARLYIHTLANERELVNDAVNYQHMARQVGIDEWLAWPNQSDYALGRIDEDQMADIYNGFDVFCLPTKGEGFGIPLIEAQACGVPVITTKTTTGPELVGPGWLIYADKLDDARILMNEAWRLEPRASEILEQLEIAHYRWRKQMLENTKRQCVSNAARYDWDRIWSEYWLPVWERLEARLHGSR